MEVKNINSDDFVKTDFSYKEIESAFSLLKIAFKEKYCKKDERIEKMLSDYMLMYSKPVDAHGNSYNTLFYFKNYWDRRYIVINEYGKIIE